MHTISRDSPCYYLTSVAKDRLLVFRTNEIKLVTCAALDEARHSLWDHHPDARLLLTEKMLMQRVHYTHQNPVRANLVQTPGEYRWSSIRYWNGGLSEDEPLRMDIDRIKWRSGGGAS